MVQEILLLLLLKSLFIFFYFILRRYRYKNIKCDIISDILRIKKQNIDVTR